MAGVEGHQHGQLINIRPLHDKEPAVALPSSSARKSEPDHRPRARNDRNKHDGNILFF